MFLSFDIGNSTLVCGEVGKGLEISRVFTIGEEAEEWREEVRVRLEEWTGGRGREVTAGISSVVPEKTAGLLRILKGMGIGRVFQLDAGRVDWFRIRYDPPGSLGSDRLAGAIGARELYGYPSIVIDFGTATTVNLIDGEGDFAGGFILPGVKTMIRSLGRSTAQLPEVPLGAYADEIGRTTEENIARGAMALTARGVEGIVARIEEKLGHSCAVVATGGLSGALFTGLPARFRREEHLLLKGIRIYGERTGEAQS